MTLLFTSISLFGQTYTGASVDSLYNCTIRINKDSSVNFIYDRDENGIYAEHRGRVKRLNDTLFHLRVFIQLGQFYMKGFHDDTLYIQVAGEKFLYINKVTVYYANGTFKKLLVRNGLAQQPDFKMHVDNHLFNQNKGSDFVIISANDFRDVITIKPLTFKIPFGSAASFTAGNQFEFDVVIKDGKLWTVGQPPDQIGHVILDKKSGT